ncbi:MAG: GNAT family N-acetyltransferase [Clostridiales bacterium]|nr:GNAT family N-acetyltransferase [Clostridiales bacterium]
MLRLRPYKEADAGVIVNWLGDEFGFRQWSADRYDRFPITAADMNAMYERMYREIVFFPVTAVDGSGIAGHLIMRYTDSEKKTLRLGFVIIDPEKRGRGLGKEMIRLAIDEAFGTLGAEEVTIGVFENNPQAYRCYKAAGFRDAPAGQPEYFHVLGEDWKCLELYLSAGERAISAGPASGAAKLTDDKKI